MKIRFSQDTYCRSIGNSSLLWHKRNSACVILEDADLFLREITWEWQVLSAIAERIAQACQVDAQMVLKDLKEFCQPLIANGLLECDQTVPARLASMDTQPQAGAFSQDGAPHDDSWTPLGSFFERHRIPCEFHIDLTSACTERCVHCYIPDYANRFLDFGLVQKALLEYKALGGLTVHLSGGECMLHPDFCRIVRFCKEQNINIIILSNLTCCDDAKLEVLKDVDPQFINVSLYSMNPAQHDAVTTLHGSWQCTMDAILKCEANGVHIRLAAPVLKENKDGYGALADFARQHHMHLIPDVDIFPQCDQDDSNMEHALSPEELRAFLIENSTLFNQGYDHCIPDAECKVCDIGRARICLDSQGHYYPCDGTHGLILGDVRTDTLADVWNGEKFENLRRLKNKDFPSCVACENRPYCKVCPAHNFNATGDILKHSPQKCAFATVKRELFGK